MPATTRQGEYYVQTNDPGRVGAWVLWLDVSDGNLVWRYRNSSNTGWVLGTGPPPATVLPYTVLLPLPDGQDATTMVQDAVAAGGVVQGAPGAFPLSATVEMRNVWGAALLGAGHSTHFPWQGDPDVPMFLLASARGCQVGRMDITASPTAYPLLTAVQVINLDGGTEVSTHNTFPDLTIDGGWGGITTGIWVGGGAHNGQNNDFMRCERCLVTNCADASYRFDGWQTKSCVLQDCQSTGTWDPVNNPTGTRAALAADGAGVNWEGGGGYGHAATIYLGNSGEACAFRYLDTEGDGMLLDGGGAARKVEFDQCRWAANKHNGTGVIADLGNCEASVTGCSFGGGAPDGSRQWTIPFYGGILIFENNVVGCADPATQADTLFPVHGPSRSLGNYAYREGTGTAAMLPEQWPRLLTTSGQWITNGSLYRITATGTISTFQWEDSTLPRPYKPITVLIDHAGVTLAPGGNLTLPGGVALTPAQGAVVCFLWDGAVWRWVSGGT